MKKGLFRKSLALVQTVVLLAAVGCGSGANPTAEATTDAGGTSESAAPASESAAAESAAPAGQSETAADTAVAEQKLRYSTTSLTTLDPQRFNSADSYPPIKGYVEGLVNTYGREVNPGTAESWEIADDNKSITFHLRQDACWSDGSPITAEDFVYSFRRLADPANACDYSWALEQVLNFVGIAYPADGVDPLPVEELGVSAPDSQTFVIQFATPAPYYLAFLDLPCFYPVKRELVEQYGDEYATSPDKLLGNGPFIVQEYAIDEKLVLVPNDKYWNRDAIKLQEVTLFVMESEAAVSTYQTGGLDFISAIPAAQAPMYLEDPSQLGEGTIMEQYMTGAVDWFCINIASETNPILANKDFRLALNYALDREEYVAIATNGLYYPGTRFVLPVVKGKEKPYVEEYPVDFYKSTAEPDKAQEYLQAAMTAMGISDPGEITVKLKISDAATNVLIAENCQDQWQRNLGINIEIEQVTYRAMLSERVSGEFDLIYAGWMPDFDDPYTYLSYFVSTNAQNGGKYSNPRYDELVNTANSFTDESVRLGMYAEAEQILMEDAGIVPLQVRQEVWAYKSNLKGVLRYFLGASPHFLYAYFE
ncbi:MAG: peptide ABC transporter substrate-binding protein [Clostridiales bacterium]|jgi:oligopeptide transport system substrate-binding protein|nr:peptide ABC transporter substrate-binding protein [Clostridiales bacterium]